MLIKEARQELVVLIKGFVLALLSCLIAAGMVWVVEGELTGALRFIKIGGEILIALGSGGTVFLGLEAIFLLSNLGRWLRTTGPKTEKEVVE